MSKIYPLGLVGESFYQGAIASCSPGELVHICHEPDNPHDPKALRVDTDAGQTIGYVPRSSWLREAIHQQGRGTACTIMSTQKGEGAFLGVVLNVTLTDDDVRERAYGRKGEAARLPTFGRSVSALLGSLIR